MKVDTAEIVVGDRVRKNLDDGIGPLCESIRVRKQLQPILVDGDFNLIAGARRLRACELLGLQVEIYVVTHLTEALDLLLAERDENTCRKDFTPVEAVEIGKRIEALEAPKAAERKAAGTNQHSEPASKLDEASKGRTDEKVAAAVGMGKDTYRKAKAVVEIGTPELVEAMDAGTVSINTASKAAKLEPDQQAAVIVAADVSKQAAVQATRKTRPLTDTDVCIVSADIEKTVRRLLNRVKSTSKGAISRLPLLTRQLRDASQWLADLADEVEAKQQEAAA